MSAWRRRPWWPIRRRRCVELLRAYRAFALANPGLYGLLFERVLPGFDPSPEARSTALDTTFGLLTTQAGRLLGGDAHGCGSSAGSPTCCGR